MKQLFIFISLLLSILNAETLPNTGLQQNQYGYYYGEGVTFGGLEIIGKWGFQGYIVLDFDENGTDRITGIIYGVSEDGKVLNYGLSDSYEIISIGNNSCFNTRYKMFSIFFGLLSEYYSPVCKLKTDKKTYGSPSNKITITVNSE